ncbi:YdcF family protein [Granulicella sp. L60]|jgi:uncharacterized SAM-binding protein YcdF (DUF218 family)|uniref:YdcF family protein n=1 Tax=Granulicella sp. L60 TaxID=1641866 RepID=UPI0020B162AC|nr:YdcF family protein [Granulicella sp. L60]
MRLGGKLLVGVIAMMTIAVVCAAFVYRTIPNHNADLNHFDTLIVLGTPANADGTASAEQRERTLEGVREFQAGVAPYVIFTGGAAHNRFVEAHVMAALAMERGVPASAIFEEGRAQNTIQNIFYSEQIMAAHHWASAEVISSPSHLPRTGLILQHYTFAWRTHAAPWPAEYTWWERGARFCLEAEYCLKLRVFGFPRTPYLPRHV